jgi:hypothetical protein
MQITASGDLSQTVKRTALRNLIWPNTQLYQTDRNVNQQANFFGRAGFDYLIDNRNTITVAGYFSNGNSDDAEASNDLYIDTLFAAQVRALLTTGGYRYQKAI